ncbi:MAG: aldehyde ferredoxin oxidoreductase N-terminal domain-containing protein [Bacteroidales bacterium]|nr:aldehyde ferredoxin oxidoreductase N-terminal domain-containing protein [Bacteroidales bacterium]
MVYQDTISRVLYIDVKDKKFWITDRKDLFDKYIGGTGVATQLLLEECPMGIDPLSPDNPIIFAVGPLVGVFPLASKTVAMFKSPHTGDLGESHAGGRSAIAIRLAGYGAIVIKGASDFPVYVSVQGNQVFFKDATTLWGMNSSLTPARIMREREKGAGYRTILRIGPAGEKMISYACVVSETYRHFGRLGLGAVFGSKKLKGIIISGKQSLKVTDSKKYKQLYKQIYDQAVNSEVMRKYHDLGTPINVMALNNLGGLPTKNLQQTSFEQAKEISGENIAEKYLGKRIACAHCPTACVHLANLRESYKDSPYFYKTTYVGYDYEPLFSLGTMLGIENAKDILILIEEVEKYAMDAMSAGVILAWATEMFEKKLISTVETAGVEPAWNNTKAYVDMLAKIIKQENDFYKALGRGVVYASEIYGGKEFALAHGKNEMSGYHTGPASHLGYLLSARHSHLCNAGYSLDQSLLMEKEVSPEEIVDKLVEEEGVRQILSSLVVCFFSRAIYKDMNLISELLALMGIKYSAEDLKRLGREIHSEKFKFKLREGFSFENLKLADRVYETKAPTGYISRDYIERALIYAKKIIEK